MPLSRADPPALVVGAGRCVHPQGPRGPQTGERDLQPLSLGPGAFPGRLADRHEHESAVHPAGAPVWLSRRAAGRPGANADLAPGGGSRSQHRRLCARPLLGHRRATAAQRHRVHGAMARGIRALRRPGPLSESGIGATSCGRHERRGQCAGDQTAHRTDARSGPAAVRPGHPAGGLLEEARPRRPGNPRHRPGAVRNLQGHHLSAQRLRLLAPQPAQRGTGHSGGAAPGRPGVERLARSP
ncbi:hypothetical protein D3C75_774660 [compost metagenome]